METKHRTEEQVFTVYLEGLNNVTTEAEIRAGVDHILRFADKTTGGTVITVRQRDIRS